MSFLTAIYLMCGLSVFLAACMAALLAWLAARSSGEGVGKRCDRNPRHAHHPEGSRTS